MDPRRPVRVFISYAREDVAHLTALESHLSTLVRQGWIEPWSDRQFRAGDTWQTILDERLHTADIMLLLVSSSFMASEFIDRVELKAALDRHGRGEMRVVPILVRPVDLAGSPLDQIQSLPAGRKPITQWSDRDQAWVSVIKGLREVLVTLSGATDSSVHVMLRSSTSGHSGAAQRGVQTTRGLHVASSGPAVLTLLHLADLHFGQDRSDATARFDQREISAALLEDVGRVCQQIGGPDYVVITGDVAFSGQPREYELASAWLKHLLETVQIGPERVLMVPGNHDVDRVIATRSFAAKLTHQGLRSAPQQLDDLLLPGNTEQLQATLWPKLSAWADFARAFGAPAVSAPSPWWTMPLMSELGPVMAVGLTTSLISFDEGDAPTNLALGSGQLTRALEGLNENTLMLALLHHPPEWLLDGAEMLARLERFPHLLFTGHVHQQGGLLSSPLRQGGSVRFIAGAGHEAQREEGQHAYSWVRVRPEGIDFFPRTWSRDRRTFQAERNSFAHVDGEGRLVIRRAKLPNRLEHWLEASRSPPSVSSPTPAPVKDPRALLTHLSTSDRVIVVNFQGVMAPPEGFDSWEKLPCERIQVCEAGADLELVSRLRETRLDRSAWEEVIDRVRAAARDVSQELKGRLHVFASAPHALGAWLGRCLDDFARLVPTFLYQFDVLEKRWLLFSGPSLQAETRPFFGVMQAVDEKVPAERIADDGQATKGEDATGGVILSLEVIQPAKTEQLMAARDLVGAARVYRLAPASQDKRLLQGLPEIAGALEQARLALERLRQENPAQPIHLLTSAPLAFLIELGTWLRPSVYGQVFQHHYDARSGRYYPVLELIGGKPWASPQIAYVAALRLVEFKRFHEAECTFGRFSDDVSKMESGRPGWYVLAGRNSSGKSSILKAIALALLGEGGVQGLSPYYPTSYWAREDAREGYVELLLVPPSAHPHPRRERLRLDWVREEERLQVYERIPRRAEELWRGLFFAAYGPFRRLGGSSDQAQMVRSTPDDLGRVLCLFNENTSLQEGVQWLKDLANLERAARTEREKEQYQKLQEVAVDFLHDDLLPDSMLRVDEIRPDGIWLKREGERLLLDQLSDGYRCVVSLILDLVRLIAQHHQRYDPDDERHELPIDRSEGFVRLMTPGMVLIDEIDAHLHVAWQQRIGVWLTRHFPGLQFIVTTHSPYICQSATEGGLIRLPDPDDPSDQLENISGSEFYTIKNGSADEAVLSRLFGVERTWSKEAEELRARVARLEVAIARGRAKPEDIDELRRISRTLPVTLAEEVRRLDKRLETAS